MIKVQIGNCTLYKGDCLEILETIGVVDVVISDPPYGITNCKWDKEIDISVLFNNADLIVSFAAEPFTSSIIFNNRKYFKEKLIWEKHRAGNFGNAKIRHLKYTEDIVILSKNNNYIFNPQMQPRISKRVRQAIISGTSKQWRTNKKPGADVSFGTFYEPREWSVFDPDWKYPGNILRYPGVVSTAKDKTEHPTQKPIKLMEYLVLTYSNVNQAVLDPFMGSGTTGVACVNTSRQFIGIEKDAKYFDIACKRIEEAVKSKQSDLFVA
jgi:site-specific DNA-methyltransferase (adenine-specific)